MLRASLLRMVVRPSVLALNASGWQGQLGSFSMCHQRPSTTNTIGKAHQDMEEFWVKNETIRRPMTPHLTIWRWQLPMLTSLGHRITGCAMAAALYGFGYGITILPRDYATYLQMITDLNMGPALIFSAKLILAFPLAFHTLNGFRHLGWDMGKGFSMDQVYKTGYLVAGGSLLLAALLTQL